MCHMSDTYEHICVKCMCRTYVPHICVHKYGNMPQMCHICDKCDISASNVAHLPQMWLHFSKCANFIKIWYNLVKLATICAKCGNYTQNVQIMCKYAHFVQNMSKLLIICGILSKLLRFCPNLAYFAKILVILAKIWLK